MWLRTSARSTPILERMQGEDERELKFRSAMLDLYDTWRREVNYRAGRFRQLITNHGAVGASSFLLGKSGVSTGFARLAQAGKLDLTMEYLVLRPEFGSLFSAEERGIARRRLTDHGMRRDQLPLEPY